MPEPEVIFAPESADDPDSRWGFAAQSWPRRQRAIDRADRYNRMLDAWVTSGSMTEAMRTVGYTQGHARYAAKTLRKRYPGMIDEVHRRRKVLARKVELNQEAVVLELARLAFANISDVVTWQDGCPVIADSEMIPEDALAAIAEISTDSDGKMKVKLHDKKGALVDLGKFMGLSQPDGVAELLAKLAGVVASGVDAEPVLDKRETARRVALLLRHARETRSKESQSA